MLWLVALVALTGTSVIAASREKTGIIVGSVVGGVVLIAVAVFTAVLCCLYYYRRVTSLEYVLSSKSREESRRVKNDEKSNLMSHEYDSVCTGDDISLSSSAQPGRERRRARSPPREMESEYSEIKRDLITRSRSPRSRSATPTDNSLVSGIRGGGVVSYGAVAGDTERYSSIRVEREGRGGQTPGSVSSQPGISSGTDGSGSGPSIRTRVTTNILQSLKHCQSGIYVPTIRQRTRPIEPQAEYEGPVYDRLAPRTNPLAGFFQTEKQYWAPAQTTSDLYTQLSDNRYREIPRQSIIMLEQLGAGQFGRVFKGLWVCEGDSLHVAVKVLQEDAVEEDRVKFLQEAALMGQFSHSNIIRLYGVVTVTAAPTLIVLELALTDLHRYLRGIRLSEQYTSHLPRQLLQFGVQVAAGMQYLSGKSFVHRDLAARNILLDFSLVCKIGDFGMARNLMDEYYLSSENRPLPVKWMAPESLLYRKYSSASDVWSFGMVLYEIWSVGRKPHEQLTNQQVIDNLDSKLCHLPPPGCPRAIYSLMAGCWHPEPRERLTFQQLYQSLCQPEEYLLSWPEEEEELPALARQLGADHTHSQNLHTDLQNKYLTHTDMY